jgi:hypothetical protein
LIIDEDEYLSHYGILRKSGRYPWGSGGQEVHYSEFLKSVDNLRKQGLKETEIAVGMNISTTELRARNAIAKNEQKKANVDTAQKLKDKGMGNVAIGKQMGLPESTVRALLKPGVDDRAQALHATAQMLKEQVAEKKYIDIGQNTWLHHGIPETTWKNAVAITQEDGYVKHYLRVLQLGTNKETTLKVLSAPGTPWSEVNKNQGQIKQIQNFSDDGGRSYFGVLKPLKISPDRVGIVWKEDGGDKLDGVIYVRRGVKDISLGDSQYAQVRIAIGDGHYMKGMAMYKDGLPKGVDLQFNTNKERDPDKLKALKEVKRVKETGEVDPDNPFGAVVRQIVVRDSNGHSFITGYGKNTFDGTERVTSAMNIVNEEGNWGDWSKALSSQVLSKQSPRLAKTQLDMTYEQKVTEFERISTLTNPTVRKKLLEELASDVDSSANHLKAAGLKDQATHVILPISSMPPTQVYAPNYENGRTVVLIRFPHGGTFEIPELTVNNNQPEAKRLLGQARDAIGIHHSVAEQLSGADFDGDTVLVIPNDGPPSKRIRAEAALEQLQGFDPRSQYKKYEGMPVMTARQKGLEMGYVSNLISDMTIKGASTPEIARAIKHSMVVIDAEKHELNYKQSEIDNGIQALRLQYQGKKSGGASTLLTRAGGQTRVPDLKPRKAAEGGPIDKATGKKVFDPNSVESYVNKNGKTVVRMRKSEKIAETSDAFSLITGTPARIEIVYAEHSNKLKGLADQVRKEAVNTPNSVYSPTAAKVYKAQVDSLNGKLRTAELNAPLERQAQIIANEHLRLKKLSNPDMDQETEKKVRSQVLQEGRNRTGAGKQRVEITRDEWDAIQAGAISNKKLSDILRHADIDKVREFATPRKPKKLITSVEAARAQAMFANGYTRAEVAARLGVSLSTLDASVQGSEA